MRWVIALLFALALVSPALGQEKDPFGLTPVKDMERFPIVVREWETMPKKLAYDAMLMDLCRYEPGMCSRSAKIALNLVERVKGLNEFERLREVDYEINRHLGYITDLEQWGPTEPSQPGKAARSERWTSPLEVLTSGKGDCEDYANLKLFILWQAGIPLANMRLVVIEYSDPDLSEVHSVLAAKPAMGRWFVLDIPLRYALDYKVLYGLQPYEVPVHPMVAEAQPAK